MIRNLKVLGLLAAAMAMVSAGTASSSQASEFHAEEEPTIFSGVQVVQGVFTIASEVTFTCKVNNVQGTSAVKTSTTLTLEAAYSTCKLAGLSSDVNMNGCQYLFHTTANASTATMDIVCPIGSKIKDSSTVTNCILEIGSQNGLQHLTFSNTSSGTTRDIDAIINIGGEGRTGFEYDETGSECPDPGHHTGGRYTGTWTIKGFKDEGGVQGAQQGVWVE